MHGNHRINLSTKFCVAAAWMVLFSTVIRGQETTKPSSATSASQAGSQALDETLRAMQVQLQTLTTQLSELREGQERARAEARELRAELEQTKMQLAARANRQNSPTPSYSYQTSAPSPAEAKTPERIAQEPATPAERLDKIEGDQELADAKINEQNQTKVESGSKYRLRLSGIALLNIFGNQSTVDNQDFPGIATAPGPFDSSHAFGGSLRQSQIGLEAFGPDIAGAHTSANVKFDFAGGFPDLPNGNSMGYVRLRTGVVRFDWANTSLIAGQDTLFFAPLAPTTLASLAVPGLSYAGNLWAWAPQVRIEHRITVSENSALLFQGGILDAISGQHPITDYTLSATSGEQSGQPAYASRISWRRRLPAGDFTVGLGGYYSRQYWGFGRNIDSWTSTTDLSLPLGRFFEFDGEFFRGRALDAFGGGIGQGILSSGSLTTPGTFVRGLDSMGGWVQLKFKPKPKFEVNGAFGEDNPFSSQLRGFAGSQSPYGPLLSKNLSPFVNFIYQMRSDVLFSVEYRRLQTYALDSNSNAANHFNLSLGYIF